MLRCDECGCVSEQAPGWVAFLAEDPDGLTPSSTVIVCPPCAAHEFGYESRVDYT